MKRLISLFVIFIMIVSMIWTTSIAEGENSFSGTSTIELERILPTLKANSSGLYPHEILAIEYANKYSFGENKFESFWWYEYGVKDMTSLLESLRERGFLSLGSLSDSLQLYKVDDLKSVLKAKGLKVSGKKQELINRLIESVSEDELSEYFPRRSYTITEKGKDAIKDDKYVLYAHRHHYEGINIYSLNILLDGQTENYRDCIWEHLKKLGLEYEKQRQYGLYRNVKYQMAEFFLEDSDYKDALPLLIEVVYWDTSGLGNGELNIEISESFWFPYETSIAVTAPAVIRNIVDCKTMLNLNNEEFRALVEGVIGSLYAPFHIFSINEIADIIKFEIDQDTFQLSRVYDNAKKRLDNSYPIVALLQDDDNDSIGQQDVQIEEETAQIADTVQVPSSEKETEEVEVPIGWCPFGIISNDDYQTAADKLLKAMADQMPEVHSNYIKIDILSYTLYNIPISQITLNKPGGLSNPDATWRLIISAEVYQIEDSLISCYELYKAIVKKCGEPEITTPMIKKATFDEVEEISPFSTRELFLNEVSKAPIGTEYKAQFENCQMLINIFNGYQLNIKLIFDQKIKD